MRRLLIALTLGCAILVIPGMVLGAERFGAIFDIQGNATVESDGKTITLLRGKHVLYPVSVGDRFNVQSAGKVMVVSLKDKRGYELSEGTRAVVTAGGMEAETGTVTVKEGFNIPTGGAKGPIGAIVLRSINTDSCIKPISPANTAIMTMNPTLTWENTCQGAKTVSVKVIKDRKVVFEQVTDKGMLMVPAAALEEGVTYRWLIESSQNGMIGSIFTTLSPDIRSIIAQKSEFSKSSSASLPERLSYIFLLQDYNLNEMAEEEIAKLEKDFPENPNIQTLR